MTLQPDRMLLHYRLVERIGAGGMGEVWRAVDTSLDREVAIKVLPERFASDAGRLSRFEREAKTLAALNDPGIAAIYSVHLSGDVPFLAMELVEGQPLSQRIGAAGLDPAALLEIAVPLADAVAAAHAAGVTHRDLKPDNVMITAKGRVKVLDFGLAKLADTPSGEGAAAGPTRTVTQQGSILGTVQYMSPEQAEGLPVDARSDVFSLGTMLYEMATGRRPFAGATSISTITSILRDQPPAPTTVRQGVPAWIDAIVARCLEKDPARRWADAGALAAALRELSPSGATGTTVAPPAPRRRKVPAVVAVVAVVLIAAAAWLWLGRGGEEQAPATPGGAAASRPVAVMGFENLSDPADAERLGRVLMGLVTTDLVESRGLEVLSTARVLAAVRESGGNVDQGFDLSVAGDAAKRAGAALMLVGQVNRDGERVRLAAELVDVATGRTVGSIRREAGSSSELFELAGSIADEVRRQLGVAPAGAGTDAFDLAESLTASADAYRQFAAGEVEFHLGRFEQAQHRFAAAIEIDPGFALAYFRMAMSQSWAGETGEGLHTLERGLSTIDRLPEHWQTIYRAYLDFEHGNWTEGYELLSRLEAQAVPVADVYYALSEILTHSSKYWDPRRVRALSERALELDPTFSTAWFHLVQTYQLADDREALRASVERRRAAATDPEAQAVAELDLLVAERRWEETERYARGLDRLIPLTLASTVEAALRLGRAQWALEICETALRDPDVPDTDARQGRGMALAWLGRFDEAIEAFRSAAGIEEQMSRSAGSFYLAAARLQRLTGDVAAARRAAAAALEADPELDAAWYWSGRLALEDGDAAAAEERLRGLEALRSRVPSPLVPFWVELLGAELRLARGDAAGALETLRRIEGLPVELRERPLEELVRARALEAAGDRRGAIAAYRKVLDPPWLLAGEQATPWLSWPLYEPELLYPLARLELADGQTAAAREHFRAYVEIWGAADRPVVGIDEARAGLR